MTGLSAWNDPSRNNRSISAARITRPYSLALLSELGALETTGALVSWQQKLWILLNCLTQMSSWAMTAKVKVERDFGVVEAGSLLFQADILFLRHSCLFICLKCIYLWNLVYACVYFWLCRVFVAAHGLSLVAAMGGVSCCTAWARGSLP